MSRDEVLRNIAQLDSLLLQLAAQELRASRSHHPGEYSYHYRELRAEARVIQKLRMDWFNLMPPAPVVLSRPALGRLRPAFLLRS